MSRGTVWGRFDRYAGKTFADAAVRYIREFEGKDVSRQKQCIKSLSPYIAKRRLIDVDGEALEGYKRDRIEGNKPFKKPAMAGTVNKELRTLKAILNCACRDWRWIPSVPRIRDVRGAQKVAYPLTWEEQDKIFYSLPEHWATGACLFGINTGVRKGELFGLKWSDMAAVPELDTIVFILRDTKNGQDRAVICNSLARLAVERQRGNGSKYVFSSRRNTNYGGMIRNADSTWRKAWYDAGMPRDPFIRKGIHNLRHTFGHRLRASRVREEDRALLLGHRNASVVQDYAPADLERLSEMAERVAERRETTILRAIPVTA